jgi:hypothetical protein
VDRNSHSILIGAACLFIIMSIAGCTTLTTETVKTAIEKRRIEPCQCEPTQSPVTIIIVED